MAKNVIIIYNSLHSFNVGSNICTWKCGHVFIHHPNREKLRRRDDNRRQQVRWKIMTLRDQQDEWSEVIRAGQS